MTVGQINRYTSWSQDTPVETRDPMFSYLVPKFFGPVVQFDTEFVEFDIVEGGVRIAPYGSPFSLGKSTRETGYRTYQLKPAYIKMLDTVRPESGFVRMPGEKYGGQLSPRQRLAMAEAKKIVLHREMVETRWEQMAAEVLFTGKLTIVDEDYPRAVVDFERDPNLDQTMGTLWSNPAADIMSDIVMMADAVNTASRGNAIVDELLMPTRVFDAMMKNAGIREQFDRNKNLGATQNGGFETGPRSSDKRPKVRGTLASQYVVTTYDGYYEDDLGAQKPFMPLDKVLFASNLSMEGRRYHGAILDMDANIAPVEIFTKSRELWNPSGVEVLTQSAPMLGLRRPNAAGVAKVL
jgi:hypothetical protein